MSDNPSVFHVSNIAELLAAEQEEKALQRKEKSRVRKEKSRFKKKVMNNTPSTPGAGAFTRMMEDINKDAMKGVSENASLAKSHGELLEKTIEGCQRRALWVPSFGSQLWHCHPASPFTPHQRGTTPTNLVAALNSALAPDVEEENKRKAASGGEDGGNVALLVSCVGHDKTWHSVGSGGDFDSLLQGADVGSMTVLAVQDCLVGITKQVRILGTLKPGGMFSSEQFVPSTTVLSVPHNDFIVSGQAFGNELVVTTASGKAYAFFHSGKGQFSEAFLLPFNTNKKIVTVGITGNGTYYAVDEDITSPYKDITVHVVQEDDETESGYSTESYFYPRTKTRVEVTIPSGNLGLPILAYKAGQRDSVVYAGKKKATITLPVGATKAIAANKHFVYLIGETTEGVFPGWCVPTDTKKLSYKYNKEIKDLTSLVASDVQVVGLCGPTTEPQGLCVMDPSIHKWNKISMEEISDKVKIGGVIDQVLSFGVSDELTFILAKVSNGKPRAKKTKTTAPAAGENV